MEYLATIGLEIHCSVKSNTKMFSPSKNGYNEMPNTNVNEIDLAFPGVLPQVNMEGVKKAIKRRITKFKKNIITFQIWTIRVRLEGDFSL